MSLQQASVVLSMLKPEVELPGDFGTDSKCGLIMATDGSVKVFTSNFPSDVGEWSDEQHQAARKMMALMIASSNEQLMAILYDVMDNTEVLDLIRQ